jgi:hypothetical protein
MHKGGFISISYDVVEGIYFWNVLQSSLTLGKDFSERCFVQCCEAADFRRSKCQVVWYCTTVPRSGKDKMDRKHKAMRKNFIETERRGE